MASNKQSEEKLAVQHNDVIFGQQSFTLLQKRLYLLAVAQIKKEDEKLKTYRVRISDLVKDGTGADIYNRLEKITYQLSQKVFKRRWMEDGKRVFELWPMIDYAKHKEGEGVVEIAFNERMKELLLQLKGNFTPVSVLNQKACQTVYGQRIYEMLYSWRNHGRLEISLMDLKQALSLENEYNNFTNFRNYVLKKAQKDLEKNTNIQFTWKELKKQKGKKITHILFSFDVNEDPEPLKLDGTKQTILKYNLEGRLKNTLQLEPKKQNKIKKWLTDNPDQQYPLSYWIHKNIEVPQPPKDLLGNPIHSIPDWSWKLINKAMKGEGFPDPNSHPRSQDSPTPKFEEDSTPVENNPFVEMYLNNDS
jgi:plasmid replication initiation protein